LSDNKRFTVIEGNGSGIILAECDDMIIRDNARDDYIELSADADDNKSTFMKIYLDGISRFFTDPIQGYIVEHTSMNGFFSATIEDIAEQTNTCEKTVKRTLKRLREIDFFRIYQKSAKGHPTIYLINPSFGYCGKNLAGQKQFKIYESLQPPAEKKPKKSTI
jgi:hypothetical protein